MSSAVGPGFVRGDALTLQHSAPSALRDVVNRHLKHLVELSAALRMAGVAATTASHCVDAAFDSFQVCLAATVAMGEGAHDERG